MEREPMFGKAKQIAAGNVTEKPAKSAITADYDWKAYYKGNFIQKWWKRRAASLVLEMAGENNPVVDLGCGSSPILSLVKATEKVGVDAHAGKIGLMKEKDSTSTYMNALAEDSKLADNYFGTTLCIEVIEHHENPHKLMQEIARITKPGGTVIIATPDFSSMTWNVIEVLYGVLMRSGYHDEHNSKFTESSVRALAAAYGLRLEETRKVLGADMIMRFRKE
ncbi:MAG: class I SAM-dependent methyltransferase [Chloroflexota bacterium]